MIYAEESFSKIDADGDGQLTKDEVLQRVEEFYYSQTPESPGNFMYVWAFLNLGDFWKTFSLVVGSAHPTVATVTG